ncbi:fluoride efflux transporter CrcB [Photobacterium sp. Hal280]|uniref:fluoride efflux transporter CrcB n=1 Tax=Photobacterium sp. Hal280 TaxID=3035163 RepID=UPI00301BEEC4
MNQLIILGYVAIGGAIGACSRYLIAELSVILLGKGFPYGTLAVNIIGSLIMGMLSSALNQGMIEATPWRPLIGLGMLGALTTFSTFSMDNLILLQQGAYIKAGLNMMLNLTLSLFACFVGFQLLQRG